MDTRANNHNKDDTPPLGCSSTIKVAHAQHSVVICAVVMASNSESSAAALQRYSAFVEEVLHPQLKQTLAHRDALAQEMLEYEELRDLLSELTPLELQPWHTLLEIGERFHVRAKVHATSLVTVDIGLHFHVEMTVAEAQTFVQKHLIDLTKKRNQWQEKARTVSDHVNRVIASIQQVAALQ